MDSSMDENLQKIMERKKIRQMEIEKEMNKADLDFMDTRMNSVLNSPRRTPSKAQSDVRVLGCRSNVERSTPLKDTPEIKPKSPLKSASRFAALAADREQFECDYKPPHVMPKEAFLKGNSPRMSIGEMRPSVLFAPKSPVNSTNLPKSPILPVSTVIEETTRKDQVQPEIETPLTPNSSKNVRFAEIIASTAIWDESSALCSTTLNESEMSKFGSSHTDTICEEQHLQSDKEVNDIANFNNEETGFQTFMVKKKGSNSRQTSSSSLIGSPKPFIAGTAPATHSPVVFKPHSTSSPIKNESRIELTKPMTLCTKIPVVNIPDKRADFVDALEHSARRATELPTTPNADLVPVPRMNFRGERTPQQSDVPSPIRQAAMDSARARTIATRLEENLKNSTQKPLTNVKPMRPGALPESATKSTAQQSEQTRMQTQWRGASGTPVVAGADPAQPSRPDVRASNIKSLRNRWEFSSATGTPLHPDADENALLASAVKMSQSCNRPKKTCGKLPHTRDIMQAHTTLNPTPEFISKNQARTFSSVTESPMSKSPRMQMQKPDDGVELDGEVFEEDDLSESREEVLQGDESRIITEAFGFMDASPNKTPKQTPNKMAPLARLDEEVKIERVVGETPIYSGPSPPMCHLSPEKKDFDIQSCRATSESLDSYHNSEDYQCSPKFVAPPPPQIETQDEACGSPSEPMLMHSVSFYRKRRHERAATNNLEKIVYAGAAEAVGEMSSHVVGGVRSQADAREDKDETVGRLRQAISVEQERIAQASRALSYCKQTHEFIGSREEVDAQRALLIATETRRVLLQEVDRLEGGRKKANEGARGGLTISQLQIPLSRDFIHGNTNYHDDLNILYYFIVLLKCESTVQHTSLITSNEAIRGRGVLEFNQYLQLKNITPDFACSLEVYALRSQMERISHEEKYRLKGGTMKGTTKGKSSTLKGSAGGPAAIMDPGFQLVGRLNLNINSVDKRKFPLLEPQHPLHGDCTMKIKRFALDKSQITYRGFLSLYQKTQGLASWTRYWCLLDNGELKFWKYPEDETSKNWLVLIDLTTCTQDGAVVEPDVNYPNSFHVDVWVPKEGSQKEMEKLRVLMAADYKDMMYTWTDVLNKTIRNLLVWSNPIGKHH